MKNWIIITITVFFSTLAYANSNYSTQNPSLQTIGYQYFNAWAATQSPDAKADDIESYLALLADNVGHQHLPYDADDSREQDGKTKMREGMQYYLGAHDKHIASLTSITTGENVIILKYSTQSEGVHPQTKEVVAHNYDTVEVLEIENGKVAVIRKYSE